MIGWGDPMEPFCQDCGKLDYFQRRVLGFLREIRNDQMLGLVFGARDKISPVSPRN